MGKNIGKNISKTKYSRNIFDHAKQSATDALKSASKKQFTNQQINILICNNGISKNNKIIR